MSICCDVFLIKKNQKCQLVPELLKQSNFIEDNTCLKLTQFDHLWIHLSLMNFQRQLVHRYILYAQFRNEIHMTYNSFFVVYYFWS